MLKLPHNCTRLTHKVMLKILQARLQQYVNCELPNVQTGVRKGQRSNCEHPLDCPKNESSKKKSTGALLTMPKSSTVWVTTNCGKFFKRWE